MTHIDRFFRAVRKRKLEKARRRRAGIKAGMPSTADQRESQLTARLESANEAASRAKASFISYLLTAVYMGILVGSTTDRMLLFEDEMKLPVLEVGLPIVGFYILSPIIMLILYINLVIRFWRLALRLKTFDLELHWLPGEQHEAWRSRLNSDLANLILHGHGARFERYLTAIVIGAGIGITPLFLQMMIQARFLAYQDEIITHLHRSITVIIVLLMVTVAWTTIRQTPRTRISLSGALFYLLPWTAFIAGSLYFSFAVAVVPDGYLDRNHADRERIRRAFGADRWSTVEQGQYVGNFGFFPWRRGVVANEQTLMNSVPPSGVVGAYLRQGKSPEEAMVELGNGIDLRHRKLRYAVFFRATLHKADFRGADLSEASFVEANMHKAQFEQARLAEANLHRTTARYANFNDADLSGAQLTYGTFDHADLSLADLRHADLRQASLIGAKLIRARAQRAKFDHADLTATDLTRIHAQGATLTETDLTGAIMRASRFKGANFEDANLEAAFLGNARMLGADLSFAHASAADLSFAELSGAAMIATELMGARMEHTRLDGVNMNFAVVDQRQLTTANLRLMSLKLDEHPPKFPGKVLEERIRKRVPEGPIREQTLQRYLRAEKQLDIDLLLAPPKSQTPESAAVADLLADIACHDVWTLRGIIRHRLEDDPKNISEKLETVQPCPALQLLTEEERKSLLQEDSGVIDDAETLDPS